ncbi:MAG: TadG family pilus assembly protein [Planctomycetota bacterium]
MLVLVVVVSVLLIGFAGLAIDAAFVGSASQQLQSAADAAALSAVRMLNSETVHDGTFPLTRQAAIDIALVNKAASEAVQLSANTANATDGDIVVGTWNPVTGAFTPTTSSPNAVRVRARRTDASAGGQLDLFFGLVFGTPRLDIGRTATAVRSIDADPLVLLLAPSGPGGLDLNGTPILDVSAGKIHSNSSDACSVDIVGNAVVSAMVTSMVGNGCHPPGSISGAVVPGAAVVPDPLAGLLPDVPAWDAYKAGMPVLAGTGGGEIGGSGTFSPGYYSGGIDLKASSSVTLQPGVYMLGGKGLTMKGGASLSGTGVTLLIDLGADVDISGNADLTVIAPDTGTFEGVAFFSHRQNSGGGPGSPEMKVGGTGDIEVQGIVYVPSGTFVMAGTPGNKQLGAMIVCKLTNSGTSGFAVTGTGVPVSGGQATVFLVE